MIRNTERVLKYPISILLSIDRRKTCEALARVIEENGDTMRRLLEKPIVKVEELVRISKVMFEDKKVFLIIDDTIIIKLYSLLIEGTSDNYDPATGHVYRSLCSVVAMLTDGKQAIPITHHLWTAKEFDPENYKTKTALAQDLIEQVSPLTKISMIMADGLYATREMMFWLCEQNMSFEMRFHSNRVIEIDGKSGQIGNHSALKLKRSKERRTIRGKWQSKEFYFTAIRRWTKKSGSIIVYLIANHKAEPRQHERFYNYRWNIEKFFRTAKQHLGFSDCQARKLTAQKNHIMNIFLAYAVLQWERKKNKLKNAEIALKRIKLKSQAQILKHLTSSGQIFEGAYA
jgi:hypothetical protein